MFEKVMESYDNGKYIWVVHVKLLYADMIQGSTRFFGTFATFNKHVLLCNFNVELSMIL